MGLSRNMNPISLAALLPLAATITPKAGGSSSYCCLFKRPNSASCCYVHLLLLRRYLKSAPKGAVKRLSLNNEKSFAVTGGSDWASGSTSNGEATPGPISLDCAGGGGRWGRPRLGTLHTAGAPQKLWQASSLFYPPKKISFKNREIRRSSGMETGKVVKTYIKSR